MAKVTIEAQLPRDKKLEDGLPLLLQMMEGAGFSNITVSVTEQIPQTYTPPPPRRSKQMRNIEEQLSKLREDVDWIKHEFIGASEDEDEQPTTL